MKNNLHVCKSLSFLFTIYPTSKYLLFGRLKLERYYNCITTTPIKDNNHYTKIKPAHERSNYPQYIYIYTTTISLAF